MVVVAAVVVVLVGVSRMSPETDRQKEDKEAADEALVAEYEQPEIAVVVPNDLSATLLFADEQAAYEASDFQNKVVAYVDDFLPVRTEPTRDSETIGKMYPGSVADVIERGEVWSKIRSGSVEGYIQNMYVCFDSEAEDIAILLGGEEELITAVSVEEEEAEKKAQEEAAAKRAAEEAARKAAQEAARQAEEERAAAQQEVTEAQTQAENTEETAAPAEEATVSPYYMELSEEDIYLIACIVDWEANSESYEGKLAVANVILNRVRSSAYPNTVSGVIYQRGQFGGVLDSSGNYSTRWQARLASGPRNDECITAARAAASGVNNVIGYLAFNGTAYCNLSSYRSYIIIGNHCFYQR
jgi:spore germination cell wall hydrolase CwlJ-like protein